MKNRWKVTAAAVMAASALVLTGCSDPGAGGGTTGSAAAGTWPKDTTNLKGTTLTLWASQSSTTLGKPVIDAFEKATGATVNVTTIPDPYEQGVQTKVASGDKPDLAYWQPTGSELTLLNPTQNLQSLEGAPWVDNYSSDLLKNIGILNKTRYAALFSSPALVGVYYNKAAFAKAGITSTPKNIDEMIADAKKIKAAGVTPFQDAGGDKWPTQYWVAAQLGDAAKDGLWTKVNENKEQFTSSTIQSAINNFDTWHKDGLFNNDDKTATYADQATTLLSGKSAMVVQASGYFQQLQAKASTSELNEKIGWFPISAQSNTATFIPDQGNALVAFKTGDDKREAAARQFLSYWLGGGYKNFIDTQKATSVLTTVQSPSDLPTVLTDIDKAVPDAAGSMQALAVANPDLYLNLADLVAGTKTATQVAQATQAQFAQQAKAQGSKAFN